MAPSIPQVIAWSSFGSLEAYAINPLTLSRDPCPPVDDSHQSADSANVTCFPSTTSDSLNAVRRNIIDIPFNRRREWEPSKWAGWTFRKQIPQG